MTKADYGETIVIGLEEVGYIERKMLVAGDVSLDGSKILLRRAFSEGIVQTCNKL